MTSLNLEMHENAYSEKLKDLICQEMTVFNGTLSFSRFMELALYAPGLGYYSAGKPKFGASGDFLTAPEISPLFAKSVARQCQQIAEHMSHYDILEIGAGSGIFAKDLLFELEKLNALPEHYYILEVSATLRQRQQTLLYAKCPHLLSRIQWIENAEDCAIRGIIFANEVMDALPVHCFSIEDNVFSECCVAWRNNQFVWKLQTPLSTALMQKGEALREIYGLPNGYQSEIHLFLSDWIRKLVDRLQQGIILLFDYGYGRTEYYHPDRSMGTLMCYHQHRKNVDPFVNVGLQDITAHIDFTTVIESAYSAGCKLAGFTTQAAFLTACGILNIAEQENCDTLKEKFNQNQAIKKLLFPSEMGESIKAMGLSKGWNRPLLGFTLLDRSRDL